MIKTLLRTCKYEWNTARKADHDLCQLGGMRLRSHGGLADSVVSFIISRPLNAKYKSLAASHHVRNYDIFEFVLDGAQKD